MKKVLVFVNPHSRQGAACLEEVLSWLAKNNFQVLNPGFDPKVHDTSAQIRQHKDEAFAVIVGGGDGSVNHALPGLLETKLPLALLPLGTANNLGRTLEIPEGVPGALAVLQGEKTKQLDVGFVNGKPFMTVVGIGLSTKVNRLTESRWKRYFGVFAFAFTALKVALRMTPFKVEIISDGKSHIAKSWQVTICNGKTYGANLPIHEYASLSDNILHGLSSEVQSFWQGLGLVPYLMKGKFPEHLPVTKFSGQEIEIRTKKPHHVDVDGDVMMMTPLKLSVRSKALKVLIPS